MNDFKDTYGTYNFVNGDVYTGGWKDDMFEGKGKETFRDGSSYESFWKEDERIGEGILIKSNGGRFRQLWRDGELIEEKTVEKQSKYGQTKYTPDMFIASMDREKIAAIADLDSWVIIPVEDELVFDGDLYYADGLGFGLKNSELVYIEAYSLEGNRD